MPLDPTEAALPYLPLEHKEIQRLLRKIQAAIKEHRNRPDADLNKHAAHHAMAELQRLGSGLGQMLRS